ncbi:sugar phosphate isomerase/epimerase family protein [Mucilaginibacter myungsuensis]|uniref:TIM barrel protein n=1 Tax=Mucilaginibacter myungsuensis TaxID=649104 RepID=A0A929L035_9SPHI|nr:sugar phosphate isomerase/epimerase [Mucilaginibacter myungsuensis]MBE9663643.1 TIM barrel protein [Mucilaginibacter myungsuensis]MDN3599033.1 TIM barrel protein [Mucilaginibacter myungsuensis]
MNNRRDFLKNMGALAAGSVLMPSLASAFNYKKVSNVGVQLYTFRDAMMADAKGTLEKIAALGIKQIESAASGKGLFYGLKPAEIKQICKDLGMTVRSGHTGIGKDWSATVAQAAEAGQEYLICSSLPSWGQTVDNYKKVSDIFNKAGEECKKSGIKFGFHNHAEEFATADGQVLFDVMLNNTDPKLVCWEMDLGWVVTAGKDPFDYFKRFPGRFPLWHLKDMKDHKSTEFGKGDLDIPKLLKHAKDSGLKYFFVEQEEYTNNPFDSMKENMDYLAKLDI